MTWWAISNTPPQFVDGNGDPYSGAVLKFYQDGTTTNTNMATDDTGGTTLASVALDSNGYPTNASAVFIPHIDQKYKTALYATQAAADADTGAIWTVDNVTAPIIAGTNTDINAKVSSNDTTTGYLNGKLTAGANISLVEGSDGGNETLAITQSITTDIVIAEQSDHSSTPSAGNGYLWVRDDAPNSLIFTDDAGTDNAISQAPVVVNKFAPSGTAITKAGIPSWVTSLEIYFYEVSTDGTSQIELRLGGSGGIEATGYNGSVQSGTTITGLSTGFTLQTATTANDSLHGYITIRLMDLETFDYHCESSIADEQAGGNIHTIHGYTQLSSILTQFSLTMVNGTDEFDNGQMSYRYS